MSFRSYRFVVIWLLSAAPAAFAQNALEKIPSKPLPCPESWLDFIGEYKSAAETLYVLEKDQALHVAAKTQDSFRLEPMSNDMFRVVPLTEQAGENPTDQSVVTFRRGRSRRATSLRFHETEFNRMTTGGEGGATFRMVPLRNVSELRKEALAAQPPHEKGEFLRADLVELAKLDSTIRLDIRYASTNNFMSEVFYSEARAFMQRPAAEAVVRAHRNLKRLGYGLLIHDAYRPWYVTKMFWEATPQDKKDFVADPSKGSRHNRGCAVDITLYDLNSGKPVEMPSGYDEFSERAFPAYPGGTCLQRWHRELLRVAMEEYGFNVYEWEWWHFDYKEWKRYPILNVTFENIK